MAGRRQNPNSLINNDVALQPGEHTSTPETKLRITEVAKKISKGWTKLETQEWIKETWGLNDTSANRYWNAALTQLAVNASDSAYVEEMRKKTIATLDRLVQTEIQEGRYKEANTSMELMSKLMGYNIQKVEAKVEGDIKFDFGGE